MKRSVLCLAALTLLGAPLALRAGDTTDAKPAVLWHGTVADANVLKDFPRTGDLPNNWDSDLIVSSYVSTAADLEKFWKALGQVGDPPEVDFEHYTLIVVSTLVGKMRVSQAGGKPVLSLAIGRTDPKRKEGTYSLAVWPKGPIDAIIRGKAGK